MAPPQKVLRIGVFLAAEVQLLDLSPIDLFAMLSPSYLETCKLPAPLIPLGIPSIIHYISLSTPEISLTSSLTIKTPKTIKDEDVQPGMLDVLLVPGPDPNAIFEEEALGFVRGHVANEGCDVLSVCTGCRVLACAGVLDGKKASAPRGLVGRLRKEHSGVEWDDERRWVRDGRIWSSGGITNGQEMVAAYLRYNFPSPATECVLAMADVGEKGNYYPDSKPKETAWWLWQIIKAATFGGGKRMKLV